MNRIMTPAHPLWNDFIERLNEALSDGDKNLCTGDESKIVATQILKSIPGIDVKKSLEFFDENGGFCDCGIFGNVDPD